MKSLEKKITERLNNAGPNGCWLWRGAKTYDGYSVVWHMGKQATVHRVLYEHFRGSVPEGLELDHLCRNRACVNPDHLEAVTHQVNCRRGLIGKTRPAGTHCKHGHEFTEANTIMRKGKRYCRECGRIYNEKRRKK